MTDLRSDLLASVALEDRRGTASFALIEMVANSLRDMLGEDFEADVFMDTLDGETDAMDILGRLILDREEAKAHEAAAKAAAATFSGRAERMVMRQKAIAKTMGRLLDAIGERKVSHPLGTVSRSNGVLSVEITDEASVPSQLCKTIKSPDKAAIRAALDAGESIPGAELRRGEPGVVVRVR